MRDMPFGTHKEIVSSKTIKTIIETASNPNNTEYLEYYLENNRNFNVNYITSGYTFNKKLRMTLDYEEDLESNQSCFKNKKKSDQNIEIEPQHKAITVNYRFYNAIFKPIPECSICLQSIIVKRATLNCGHTFHKSCIDKVTRSNTCPKCPMCRADIV